jgi:dihydrofolate reductase
MRRMTLFIACSLDGFIAREDGGVDWLFTDSDYGYKRFFRSIDTMLMGRRTYEKALELGDRSYLEKRWYVFSRKAMGREGVVFSDQPLAVARRLRRGSGKGIWLVGGAEIASLFLDAGVIDEIRLFVHPIRLGRGIPLFRPGKEKALRLMGAKKFRSGLVELHYRAGKDG